ncbi:MAG TPA: response regulator [Enterovirga sp.]|jgi:CheY-like chemotaxis protein
MDHDQISAEGRLKEQRVLLVEDEMMVAMLVEDMLLDVGCEVIGPVTRVDEALARTRDGGIDVAILDVNLDGQETYAVADALTEKGIPFVFATGYGAGGLKEGYKGTPTLQKPFQQRDLIQVLADAVGNGAA